MLIDKYNTYDEGIKFDENILCYFEENDFFHQCLKKIRKYILIEDLEAYHLGGSVNDITINMNVLKNGIGNGVSIIF